MDIFVERVVLCVALVPKFIDPWFGPATEKRMAKNHKRFSN